MSDDPLKLEVKKEVNNYFEILANKNKFDTLKPSDVTRERFAAMANISQPTAKKILFELIDRGEIREVIKRIPRTGNKVTTYEEIKKD